MTRKHTARTLESFSWKREVKLSAAKERLSGQRDTPRKGSARRAVGRIVAIIAVLLAAALAAAMFHWPAMEFIHRMRGLGT